MFGGESERTATQFTRGDAAPAAFVLMPQKRGWRRIPRRTNEFASIFMSRTR
jgi:hypothetical protein